MTVSGTNTLLQYTANGSTTDFDFDWHMPLYEEASLKVYLNTTLQSSGYTVTFDSNDYGTGTVSFSSAPADGVTVSLLRDTARTQDMTFIENNTISDETHELAMDKLLMMLQEVNESADSIIKFPTLSTSTGGEILTPVGNGYIIWGPNGELTATDPVDPNTLDGVGDVTITSPSNDEIITYDGSGWVNSSVPSGDGGYTTIQLDLDTETNTLTLPGSANYNIQINSLNGSWADLDNITGSSLRDGQRVIVMISYANDDIYVSYDTGNILSDNSINLNALHDRIWLQYVSSISKWVVLSRQNNYGAVPT